MHLRCFFHGHQDLRQHAPGRLFLRCTACGRETPGWVLDIPGPRYLFPVSTRGLPGTGRLTAYAASRATAHRFARTQAVVGRHQSQSNRPHTGRIARFVRPSVETSALAYAAVGARAEGTKA